MISNWQQIVFLVSVDSLSCTFGHGLVSDLDFLDSILGEDVMSVFEVLAVMLVHWKKAVIVVCFIFGAEVFFVEEKDLGGFLVIMACS